MEDEKKILELEIIYNEIIAHSKSDELGVYWENFEYDRYSKVYFSSVLSNLYNGNSGILLFLIEYYNQFRSESTLRIIEKSANWLIGYCKLNRSPNYSFYTGIGGVAYVLSRVFEITGNTIYLDESFSFMDDCWRDEDEYEEVNYDLLSGLSGVILALMHLVRHDKRHQNIYHQIERFTNRLIRGFRFNKAGGVSWGRSGNAINSLCGFSHGAAGIYWVLSEIAYFCANDELLMLAYQAYLYEELNFNDKHNNWPDFRTLVSGDADFEERYLQIKEVSISRENKYMTAWCHGAPGIGLARLRMYELTGDSKFLKDAEKALRNTIGAFKNKYISNYSLCHGVGGNSYFVSRFYSRGDRHSLKNIIDKNMDSAVAHRKTFGKYRSGVLKTTDGIDLSLFNGYAGVGYFLLFSRDSTVGSLDVLCPVANIGKSKLKLNLNSVLVAFYENLYPITIYLLRDLDRLSFEKLLKMNVRYGSRRMKFFLRQNLRKIIDITSHKELLSDAFVYESRKIKFDAQSIGDSFVLLDGQKKHFKNQNATIEMDSLFCFNTSNKLLKTKWPWHLDLISSGVDLNKIQKEKGVYFTVLKPVVGGVKEFSLNDFSYLVLKSFEKSGIVADALKEVKKYGDGLEVLFFQQVREFVFVDLLIGAE